MVATHRRALLLHRYVEQAQLGRGRIHLCLIAIFLLIVLVVASSVCSIHSDWLDTDADVQR